MSLNFLFKFIFICFLIITFSSFGQTTYYINSINGNDTFDGLSSLSPWQTIDKINTITLYPGDSVRFYSGQTFLGMFQPIGNGNINNPIIIDSYGGNGRAIINGENHLACIYLDNKEGIEISNCNARKWQRISLEKEEG